MANINLTPGERYTFGKLKGVSVITDSTDNAQSPKYIRNTLFITSSANESSTIQIDTPGTGDPALRFSIGSNTIDNWVIGIDNSDGGALKINNAAALSTGASMALRIDTNENISIPGDLIVTGSVIIPGSTIAINTSWTAYTPQWTAASVNPAIGNGTLEGWYKVIGKTCFVRGNIVMGSTTTFGTGEWYVSMPFTASHADAILMTANLLDNGSAWYNATLNGARAGFNFKTAIQYQSTGGTALDVRSNQPFTWANTDRFIWNGSFEIA
jgi:hypothetical protein